MSKIFNLLVTAEAGLKNIIGSLFQDLQQNYQIIIINNY
jgi:hypothetical protein